MMNIRSQIEIFHILFCRLLLTAQDKSLIALKGGCNLRLPVEAAIEAAMSIDVDQFAGQVVAFLDDESRLYYRDASAFYQVQQRVILFLEGLSHASH